MHTGTVYRAVVYSPQRLAELGLNDTTLFSIQHFLQVISEHDVTAGGYSLRSLVSGISDGEEPAIVAIPLNFFPSSQYHRVATLADCLTEYALSQIRPSASADSPSTADFRSRHNLSSAVHIYSIYIVQPVSFPTSFSLSGIDFISFYQAIDYSSRHFSSVASFLTSRYAYEHHLLTSLPQPGLGLGVAYQHYSRYRVLDRIAAECGLQINRPSHRSSAGALQLRYPDLLEWAGVVPGSFATEKGLIIQAEQRRHELAVASTRTAKQSLLLAHLDALARDPLPPPAVRPPSQVAW